MLDKLTSMQIFVDATTLGSLSAAGRKQNITPAMAGKHLDALENQLGVKLLHRSTRQLKLTDVGQEYLQSCRQILQAMKEADNEVASSTQQAVGKLRMNIPLSFGIRHIAPLMREFCLKHPSVEVELGLIDSQIELIKEGWDLAIRIGHLQDSTLKTRKLGECAMYVCASPTYLQQFGTPKHIAELSEHNCMSYTLSSSQKNHWRFGINGDKHVPVSGNLSANSGDALLAAAIAGQGIIYQPEFIVKDALEDASLVAITLDYPSHYLGGLHILFPPHKRLPTKVRVMIDFLVEAFKN